MDSFRHIINKQIHGVVGRSCVMPDLPYYSNVGDLLIWEGMERFLKDNGTEVLWRTSLSTFEYREIPADTTVCLVGGGNFGDLWRGLQEFRNKIIRLYPHNRIVIFPQSVHYDDESLCEKDAAIFSTHPDIYICARDNESFEYLTLHFLGCHILLVPDMALYLDLDVLNLTGSGTLFLKREDKEAASYDGFSTEGMTVSDWPVMRGSILTNDWRNRLRHKALRLMLRSGCQNAVKKLFLSKFNRIPEKDWADVWTRLNREWEYLLYLNNYRFPGRLNGLIDWFAGTIYKPFVLQYGTSFIGQYDTVYSTRLHAGLLGYLLGREVHFINDLHGKISSFYHTWMEHEKGIDLVSKIMAA